MKKNFWTNEIKIFNEHYLVAIEQGRGDWSYSFEVRIYRPATKKNFFGKTISFYDYWFDHFYCMDDLEKGINTILEAITAEIMIKLRNEERVKNVLESLDKWTTEK